MPVARLARTISAGALARLAVLAAGLSAGVGAACTRTQLDGDAGGAPSAAIGGATPVRIAHDFDATTLKTDPYAVESATIEGNVLTLGVRYGGGCAQHQFSLVVSRGFRESIPVQTTAVLAHDAGGDNCRALKSEALSFDLTPLRDLYRADYRTQSGTIILHLWHQERTVRYDF